MNKRLLFLFTAVLVTASFLLNFLGGCSKKAEEASSETSTAALPDESQQSMVRDAAFTYTLYETYAVVSSYIGQGATVAVPETVSDLPILGIGENAFANNAVITRVILPACVVDIGAGAFGECRNLATVEMPGIKAIGVSAFKNAGLTSVDLPITLQNIGQHAFSGTMLTEVYLNGKIPIVSDYLFANCSQLKKVTFSPGVQVISDRMFYNCPALETVAVPDTVTRIDGYAFASCPALTKVEIPASVETLGQSIFYGSSQVTVYTPSGSAAARYCERNGIACFTE